MDDEQTEEETYAHEMYSDVIENHEEYFSDENSFFQWFWNYVSRRLLRSEDFNKNELPKSPRTVLNISAKTV